MHRILNLTNHLKLNMKMTMISTSRFLVNLAAIACCVAVILGTDMAAAQCQGDVQGLAEQCARYVQKSGPKIQPSGACCSVVQNVDLACVCGHITAEVGTVISMEKATFIAEACGKPLPHGTRCGSYVVP